MLTGKTIRDKLLIGIALLLVIVVILAASAVSGNYAYRSLARSVSVRASELPLAIDFSLAVTELRHSWSQATRTQEFTYTNTSFNRGIAREEFRSKYMFVEQMLRRYREQLEANNYASGNIGNRRKERELIRSIDKSLEKVASLNRDEDWLLNHVSNEELTKELEHLHEMSIQLPSYLIQEMQQLKDEVQTQYHAWITISVISAIAAFALLGLFIYLFWLWMYRPFHKLLNESRRIAINGDFNHRIKLETQDEMATLADAMNGMTQRFQKIQQTLNQEVEKRTDQVVRSEKMASVGFLAAGVAHEINNPLASIAFCAESLQARLKEAKDKIQKALDPTTSLPQNMNDIDQTAEVEVLESYLLMIEEEAFRCKEITERLLDFSRLGDAEKHDTDLNELIKNVIDMVRHLGKYREKQIEFTNNEVVYATVNPPELKQVVLNLLTNALDSIEPGGTVRVEVINEHEQVILKVIDNGVGIEPHIIKHLFEPFFTHGKQGYGTGLGLSISSRIITEHGGSIKPFSAGKGQGTTMTITLPNLRQSEEKDHRYQAA